MYTYSKTTRILFLLICLSALAIVPALAAPPAQEPAPLSLFESMRQGAGGNLEVYWDEDTGVPRFLTGDVPTPQIAAADTETTARAFFDQYAGLYRLKDPRAELALAGLAQDERGMQHARFQQEVNGVPVWGAVLAVHTGPEGRIVAVNGEYLPDISLDVTPGLGLAQAVGLARKDLGDQTAELRADKSELTVYARHQHPPVLAWKINLFSANPLGNWLYFVDARTGDIVHRLNQLDTAKLIETYDARHGYDLPGLLVCSGPTCSSADVDVQAAHRNVGITYDYFKNTFGRDSYDNKGAPIRSSVHFDEEYSNAFWNGEQLVFGDGDGIFSQGLARALDVVAHEFTHAVTDKTAGLIYEDQSGALNETFSDIFGTLVEYYGEPDRADWLVAEDVFTPAIANDAMRDMSNPSAGQAGKWNPVKPLDSPGQPDHMSLYAYLPLSFDQGGVHSNSGITNKAAYLIAQGGAFYGVNVAPIGREAMGRIFYRTLTMYLTPGSNFMSARYAAIRACQDLYGRSHSYCGSVQNGFAAVGIGPATSNTFQLHFPLIFQNSGCSSSGIHGRVTQKGAAAANVGLILRHCETLQCSAKLTTTTNANGCYNFTDAPGLSGSEDFYQVLYVNPSTTTSNGRLYMWRADNIYAYTAGSSIPGGTFDIADVVLGSPNSATPVRLPVTFNWTIRSALEMYQLEAEFADFNPEYGRSSYTLTGLPEYVEAGQPYEWGVAVLGPDGEGYSYYTHNVTFAASASASAPAPVEAVRVPTWQVWNPEEFRPRR